MKRLKQFFAKMGENETIELVTAMLFILAVTFISIEVIYQLLNNL